MKPAKCLSTLIVPWSAVLLCSSCFAYSQGRPQRKPQASDYTLEQAVSDSAQLHTIAFSGLAFITGDYGASTFIPPGKVCDYFGFQYMRDIDQGMAGHNPKFLSRVAGNVLRTLGADQLKDFQALAAEQSPQYVELAQMRLPVIKAFWDNLQGSVPQGSKGLNEAAVKKAVGDIFARDGEMSYRRAEVMGKVARSLTPGQKEFFAKVKFGDFATWPAVDEREEMRKIGPRKSKMESVAFMTYASEFYSWYAGSVEADTYFCPERHGTYFGGFYMKDMPAMGKRDFDISLSRTSDSGRDFLETLNSEQKSQIRSVIELQRSALKEAVELRRKISIELRKFLAGQVPDKAAVVSMCRKYGELDGRMSWLYATAFARVNKTLTDDQRTRLMKIRDLDEYKSAPYYVYADAARDQPPLKSADALFFPPKD